MTAIPTIHIQNAFLAYKDQVIFNDLNLSLPAGKTIALLGPSGVGKSSLLRLIAGLQTGTTWRADIETSDQLPLERRIAYMGQEAGLMPWLTLLDNVLVGFRLRSEKKDRKKALALLNKMGLSEALEKKPQALSGGMKQRAALARTLVENRPIVLMDEPFSALDAITRLHLQNMAADLLRDKTVLLVTHDPLEALRIADIVYVLKGSPALLSAPIYPKGDIPRDLSNRHLIEQQLFLLETLK